MMISSTGHLAMSQIVTAPPGYAGVCEQAGFAQDG